MNHPEFLALLGATIFGWATGHLGDILNQHQSRGVKR